MDGLLSQTGHLLQPINPISLSATRRSAVRLGTGGCQTVMGLLSWGIREVRSTDFLISRSSLKYQNMPCSNTHVGKTVRMRVGLMRS